MNKFNYTAKNAEGGLVRDMIESDSRQSALATLRNKGLTVVSLTEVEPVMPLETAAAPKPGWKERLTRRLKISRDNLQLAPGKTPKVKVIRLTDMAVFCRQLAISVNSGLSLREALEGIYEDMDIAALKTVLANIIKKLHDGIPFSKAIAAHPKTFSPVFIGMIVAAEEAGSLAETLDRLAGYMEARDKLQRKVKSMLAYPAFVVVFFVFICLVMMFAIVPRFQAIFSDLNAKLPPLTRFVFGFNSYVLEHVPLLALLIVLIATGYILYRRNPKGRLRIDRMKLKLPVIGIGIKRYIIARICRCMAIMLKSGVPISTTLRIVAGIGNNVVIESAIDEAKAKIISGSAIADGLAESGIFPALLIRMLRVGESAGRLPDVLDRVADAYEDQVEASMIAGTALMEPVIITLMGLMVLILVLSIYLPVFTVSMSIK
jgi:type II secretory pathway component PulF